MRNAVVDTVTGRVKRYGRCDFTAQDDWDAGTETQVSLNGETSLPEGVPLEQVKVVAGDFTTMTPAQRLPGRKQRRKDQVDSKTFKITRLALGVDRDSLITAGAALKVDIDAAANKAALDAIVDTRVAP